MSLEKERAKERIHHTYHFLDFTLSCVSLVILILAAALLKFYRPSYDTIDLAVTLSIGVMLGMISLQSHRLVLKRYSRKLEELDKNSPAENSEHGQR